MRRDRCAHMLIAVLPCVFLLLTFAFVLSASGWRRAVVQAMVAFDLATALICEALSRFHALAPVPVAITWLVILLGLACVTWSLLKRNGHIPSLDLGGSTTDKVCLAGIAGIVIVTGLVARVAVPSAADAVSYHMPRIVFWAQSRSLDLFPTSFPQQITMQPFNEYLMLHTYLLSGMRDCWVNVVQWFAFVGCIVTVSLITEFFVSGRRARAVAALFCATVPTAVLQASGTKNDMTLTFLLTATAYFLLAFFEQQSATELPGARLLAFSRAPYEGNRVYLLASTYRRYRPGTALVDAVPVHPCNSRDSALCACGECTLVFAELRIHGVSTWHAFGVCRWTIPLRQRPNRSTRYDFKRRTQRRTSLQPVPFRSSGCI